MPTRELICAYCGKVGEIDLWGENSGVKSSPKFKYLGQNPVSGHMHIQCPACGIVTLASPLSILGCGIGAFSYHPLQRAISPDLGVSALSSLMARLN